MARIAPDVQEAIATARYLRMSPTKARQVVDLIRGRHVDDARRVLRFNVRGAAEPIAKVLDSAVANAEHNRGLPADELVVARAWVDEGPTLKRFRPRAMGRATRVRKRTCHVSVVVGRPLELIERDEAAEVSTARKSTRRAKKDAATAEGAETGATETTAPKPAAKKTSKKPAAKKTAAKKTAAKKPAAEKTGAKKTGAKKTAAKKTSAKKPTKKPTTEEED